MRRPAEAGDRARPLIALGAYPRWGAARAAIVVFGGLAVLQSSDAFDAPKMAYFALAVAAAASSAVFVVKATRSRSLPEVRLLVASALLLIFLAASLPIALAHGTPFALWLRDSATYGLIAVAAVVAVDLGRSTSRNLILAMFVIAGIIGTAAFTLEWMDLRDILTLSLPWTPLPSGPLASALFVTASAFALRSQRRVPWAILAGLLLASFLVIGTRSRLPFIAVPIVLALISDGARWRSYLQPLTIIAVATVVFFGAAVAALSLASNARDDPQTGPAVDAGALGGRIGSVVELVQDPTRDPSFQERVAQTTAAWDVFLSNPIVGTSPGFEIEWIRYDGQQDSSYYLDTPAMELAKFGLIGLALRILWVAALALFIRDGLRRTTGSPEVLALIGYSIILVYSVPLSPPTQDKGTAFALIFLIALGTRALRTDDPAGAGSA